MTSARDALLDHLGTGVSTVCRAWSVARKDGLVLGFTDHDNSFVFEGIVFKASTGMTARALQQTTGLSVDNSEASGALSDDALNETDILQGRLDGAEVRIWLVNWRDPAQRIEQFRGSLGEITRAGGAFKAELRGLTDQLNQTLGRVFQRGCTASLADRECGVVLETATYSVETVITGFDDQGRLLFDGISGFPESWFERGKVEIRSGLAQGLVGIVKLDRVFGAQRVVDLWQRFATEVSIGDQVRLVAGCDKLAATCRSKFANFLNFRGFPHIPGEDWLASYPVQTRKNDGGSLGR
jgi:uncharacterized phage protein (TIGR02218 family)